MSKSVRHIHARPGQHIVVHRHHWRRPRTRTRVVYTSVPESDNTWLWVLGGVILVALCTL